MAKVVDKGWGREIIFADTEHYAGKLLQFNQGAKFSMHFHHIKDESWYVLEGNFRLTRIDTNDSSEYSELLKSGSAVRIYPLIPHQLECVTEGVIIEVSMPDDPNDNYRVRPGDSQCKSQ